MVKSEGYTNFLLLELTDSKLWVQQKISKESLRLWNPGTDLELVNYCFSFYFLNLQWISGYSHTQGVKSLYLTLIKVKQETQFNFQMVWVVQDITYIDFSMNYLVMESIEQKGHSDCQKRGCIGYRELTFGSCGWISCSFL